MDQESQFVYVPPHIGSKLTYQESQLFRAINRKKLDSKIRQEILGIFDAYVEARERLKAEEEEDGAQQNGRRIATPGRDGAEEEAEREWDKIPEHAFGKIASQIHGRIEQMNFGFSAGDDEESEEENLVFHLLPRFPDKQRELMVFWNLALFLSGDHVDWLRGRCDHCKRFVINSDSRVKYCTSKHKDLYWNPEHRAAAQKNRANRRCR
jgi:hypothetical protein